MVKLTDSISRHSSKIQNLLMLIGVNFIIAAVGFMTKVKLANILGKNGFGLIAFAMAISAYSTIFIRFGTDKTLVRDLIHYPERFGAIVVSSLILRYGIMLVFILGLLSWKFTGIAGSNLTWGACLLITGTSMVSLDLQASFDSKNEMKQHAIFKLIYKCIYFLLIWAAVFIDPKKISLMFVGWASVFSVVLYLMMQYYWFFRTHVVGGFKQSLHSLSSVFEQGLKGNALILVAGLGSASIGYFNQLVLSYYHGISELGVYAAAWLLVTAANLLLMQIMRVAGPAIARLTRDDSSEARQKQFLFFYALLLLTASSPMWLSAFIVPNVIIDFLFKVEFASAANLLRIFGLYIVVLSVGIVASQYLINMRMEKSYLKCVSLGSGVGLLLSFILIPKYSATGCALAVLLTHAFTIMLYWYVVVMKLRHCS